MVKRYRSKVTLLLKTCSPIFYDIKIQQQADSNRKSGHSMRNLHIPTEMTLTESYVLTKINVLNGNSVIAKLQLFDHYSSSLITEKVIDRLIVDRGDSRLKAAIPSNSHIFQTLAAHYIYIEYTSYFITFAMIHLIKHCDIFNLNISSSFLK